MEKRSFWFLASFWLSYRVLQTRSVAKALPKTKNPRSEWLQYFFNRSRLPDYRPVASFFGGISEKDLTNKATMCKYIVRTLHGRLSYKSALYGV